jgi:hypothetical protein
MTGRNRREDRVWRGKDVADTFADRLAEAIAALIAQRETDRELRHPQPETIEQLIAVAICKELPR